jgi:DNA modification methylase
MLLLNGDCIEEMQKMIDEGVQVDSVVTDPPYELGFMGKSWDSRAQKVLWVLLFRKKLGNLHINY